LQGFRDYGKTPQIETTAQNGTDSGTHGFGPFRFDRRSKNHIRRAKSRRMMKTFITGLLGCFLLAAQAFVDIPRDPEFPADECRLLSYINAKGGGDMAAMRRHAWHLFKAISQPAGVDSTPRWQTWYQWGDQLDERPLVRSFRLRKPFEFAGIQPPAAEVPDLVHLKNRIAVLYNRSAYSHLINKCLGGDLKVYAACKSVPEFDRDAVAVKKGRAHIFDPFAWIGRKLLSPRGRVTPESSGAHPPLTWRNDKARDWRIVAGDHGE